MTQRDRDRLVVLKKAQKKLIAQEQAAEELGVTERHVRRLLVKLKKEGDQAVIHGLRGQPSNRKRSERTRDKTCGFSRKRSIAVSVRRWPASIWPRNTRSGSAAKRCAS